MQYCSSMSQQNDTLISPQDPHQYQKEVIYQQYQLITVLKEQIIRLQDQNQTRKHNEQELNAQVLSLKTTINALQDKINNILENNQSLLRTVHVFQREFARKEGGPLNKLPIEDNTQQGPFHLQIVRNLKSKISNTLVEPSNTYTQKSKLADYYGFSLQDQTVEESQVLLFNELVEKKKSISMSKIRSLGKKKCFHQSFRHVFWFKTIENKQRINQKLYSVLIDKHEGIENIKPKRSLIELDLRRMDLRLDEEKSKTISAEIKKLLELFELYRPDIKYVQGMSYLAWIFLIRMNPYQAFSSFCNLILSDAFVYSLYSFNENSIKTLVSFFGECLKDKKPKLYKHMKDLAVDTELFLIEWAYTMYSRAFSLRLVSKIWDLWFSEGYNIFFKVALSIFQVFQPELMELQQNDKVIDIIRNGTLKVEENELLKLISKQKLFEELKIQ